MTTAHAPITTQFVSQFGETAKSALEFQSLILHLAQQPNCRCQLCLLIPDDTERRHV